MSNVDERARQAMMELKAGGFTMSEFAAETGTAKQNVSAFMHGRRGALICWLEALARHGYSCEWLLMGTGEKRKI